MAVEFGVTQCRICSVVLSELNTYAATAKIGNRICKDCKNGKTKQWIVENREKNNAYHLERYRKTRAMVIEHYGGKCSCCGEAIPEFLTLDHINNDGAKQRRDLKSKNIYANIVKMGFPPDFRVLCWNCNCGRRLGACPHEKNCASQE